MQSDALKKSAIPAAKTFKKLSFIGENDFLTGE
jgi:hypothetical protein